MAGQDREGEGSTPSGSGGAEGPDAGLPDAPPFDEDLVDAGGRSPLFHAEHAERYERQRLIKRYQELHDCRLIVVLDLIFGDSILLLEELLYDADPGQDLHMMLDSPGGDGETAVRMVRSAQARCRELTVIVPDQAKSAGTILAMGAHTILMGPTSDLGPVDPQFQVGQAPNRSLVSAKDIIAAVEAAEEAIAENPDTYPLHASLLAEVDALRLQQARSALARTTDLVAEALHSNPDRSDAEVDDLKGMLKRPLIDLPRDHGAVFGAEDAEKHGLPVVPADPQSEQWKLIWRLYARYRMLLGDVRVYEAEKASRIIHWTG